jgi:hypothetical protein
MFAASFSAALRLLKDQEQVVIRALDDELVERVGYRPGDPYTTDYWLPLLGPATFAVGCRLAGGVSSSAEYPVMVAAAAEWVGLRSRKGHMLVKRSMARLVGFELAAAHQCPGGVVLLVRRAWAPLTVRQVLWLPDWLAEHHRHEHGQETGAGGADDEVGAEPDEMEQ